MGRRHRVTIEDIAAEVGVSRQTVSRAINGMARISDETRDKVLRASERLGYRPSRFAANLARVQKTRTIGFVVESLRNPFYPELTADVLTAATDRGWQMAISAHDGQPVVDLITRVAAEVDVVAGYLYGPEEQLLAAARGVPLVMVGRSATIDGLHSVDIDISAGLEVLIAALIERGSRRFGFIDQDRGGWPYSPSPRRLTFERLVPAESAEAVEVSESRYQSFASGAAGFRRLMERFPETDTVIAWSDTMAMGALGAAHEMRFDVPDRIKIVGIDGLGLGAITHPPLSSLSIMNTNLADKIVTVVDRIFSGTAGPSEREVVVPQPLWRGTA